MLKELQQDFARAITDGETGNISPHIKPGKTPAEKLLGIYRGNSFAALTQVLQLTYPVVEKLVGADFFKYAAHEFIQDNWPENGDMDSYGENFAGFLAGFAPVAELVYLPDTAKFEWLYQESALAENAKSLAAEAFTELTPEDYLQVKLRLHPSARLFSSPYPIEKIWRANMENSGEDVSLAEGGCQILLLRPETQVMLHSLSAPEYIFLQKLLTGVSLYEAYEMATEDEQQFALDICLQSHILNGSFSEIYK